MNELLDILIKYGSALSVIGAGIAFIWTIIQFVSVRAREAKNREFDNFHRLIEDLVEPPTPEGALYVDRQCAILFELRFFPRYYPIIKRTLEGLKSKWSTLDGKYERLLDEVRITIQYIEYNKTGWKRFIEFFRKINY